MINRLVGLMSLINAGKEKTFPEDEGFISQNYEKEY